jgi:hypothetical protein
VVGQAADRFACLHSCVVAGVGDPGLLQCRQERRVVTHRVGSVGGFGMSRYGESDRRRDTEKYQ